MNHLTLRVTGLAVLIAASTPAYSIVWPTLNEDLQGLSTTQPNPKTELIQDAQLIEHAPIRQPTVRRLFRDTPDAQPLTIGFGVTGSY